MLRGQVTSNVYCQRNVRRDLSPMHKNLRRDLSPMHKNLQRDLSPLQVLLAYGRKGVIIV